MHIVRKAFFFVLLFSPGHLFAQEAAIDVQHYAFHITLSDESDEITGKAEVTVRFILDEVQQFGLDLISKKGMMPRTGMAISSIMRHDKVVSFTHENDRVSINMDTPAQAGEEQTFTVSYAGVPADGLIIAKNKFGERTFFGDNWPNRARNWLPTVDHPSDKATVEFIVTAPDHYQVIGNGLKIEESDFLNGTRRTHWRTDVPIATKVTVIGAAQFAVQHATPYNGIPVQNWLYPQDRKAGFSDFSVTNKIMDFFVKNIGPYSYEKLANVQSKTRYGGMENASNIFYSETAITGTGSNEGLVAHEIAHQWFGNSATEADWQHIWLSEGFATYFTQLYMEHTYGRERFVNGMDKARMSVLGFYDRMPNSPLVNPEITDPNQHLNANSYQKGAWVLHMLRHKVGDDAFWQGIQTYYATYRNKNATSEQLQKEMEDASGQNLSQFFKQWLYQPGQPMIEGNWNYDKATKQVYLSLEQTQKTGVFETAIEVALIMSDGSRKIETVQLNKKNNTFNIASDSAPAVLALDPEVWLLAGISLKKD